jgi:predicted phosphodiesterase
MMRLAVFSDVHGNLSALEAVLTDITAESPDQTVFVGDLCLFGPRPASCLDLVRDLNCISIFGNTEDWLLDRQTPPDHFIDLAKWTYEQLDEGQKNWLDGLPFEYTISPTTNKADSMLIVHANPVDVNQIIFPPEEAQVARYGRVRQQDADLDQLLTGLESNIVVFGHLHIPFIRSRGQLKLFNISSTSMPGDGDPRAKYGLFTWDGHTWTFERKYVPFDIAPEIAAFRRNQPPGWQNFIDTIAAEGAFPQKV